MENTNGAKKEVNLYAMLFMLVVLLGAGFMLGQTVVRLYPDTCAPVSQAATSGVSGHICH